MRPQLVYLSGPIKGLDFYEATGWRASVASTLSRRSGGCIQALSPMRGKEALRNVPVLGGNHPDILNATREAIWSRDRYDVERADAMLAFFGERVVGRLSVGTLVEIAWAGARALPVVAVVPLDTKGWSEILEMLQHPLVAPAIGWQPNNMEDAIKVLLQLLGPAAGLFSAGAGEEARGPEVRESEQAGRWQPDA